MTHNYLDNAKSFVNLPLYTTPMDMKSKNQAMTEVQIFSWFKKKKSTVLTVQPWLYKSFSTPKKEK